MSGSSPLSYNTFSITKCITCDFPGKSNFKGFTVFTILLKILMPFHSRSSSIISASSGRVYFNSLYLLMINSFLFSNFFIDPRTQKMFLKHSANINIVTLTHLGQNPLELMLHIPTHKQ